MGRGRMLRLVFFGFCILFLLACVSSCGKKGGDVAVISQQRIDSLLAVATDSLSSNPSFAKAQVDSAMAYVADSIQYHEVMATRANCCFASDMYDTSRFFMRDILSFCSKAKPSGRIRNLRAMAYNLLGLYYQRIGNIDSAIFYLQEAYMQKPTFPKQKMIPNVLINLGDTYMQKGDLANAAFYFRRALFVSDSLNITNDMGFPIYFGLGQVYLGLRDFDLSDSYFRKAEKTFYKRTLGEQFTFCNNRGNYYYYKEEYSTALSWFRRARAIVLPRKLDYSIYLCELNMSDIFFKLNRFDSSEYYLNRSFRYFKSIKQPSALYYLNTIRAGIAIKNKNKSLALNILKRDSSSAGVDPNIVLIRNKCLQRYYENMGDYKLAYHFFKQNVHLENTVQSETVRNRVAELDMRYQQDTSLLKRDLLIQAQDIKVKKLKYERFFWGALCFLILGTAAFSFVYSRKQRDLQRALHLDQVTKLRLASIRNRVSPHFAFNVLNRQIVTAEDVKQQNELRGLVKLLRKSLEMSEHFCVPLQQELEFVQTYIDLERKSIGDDFSLSWYVDEKIDSNELYVPAMIVQIPVENAIKHALRGKEGEKLLDISVVSHDDGALIQIQDNGSGFVPGMSISKGTGTGLRVVYQTIQLLNARNSRQISFNITNLKSSGGGHGTRVDIFIPSSYSFLL